MKTPWMIVWAGIAVAACGDGGGSKDAEASDLSTVDVDGRVQKGPFINGTTIDVAELDESLAQTGSVFSTTIVDDTGTFGIDGITLMTPLVRIAADGFFFDEIRGELSEERLAIFTYADITDATTVNVNLLGHLEASRILYLVTEQGQSFAGAKAQAHEEVLAVFSFAAEGVAASELLDISQAGAGNAKLLAMSIILQGTRSVAELAELLSNMQTDLRTDGILDSTSSGEALMNGARTLNLVAVRENLETRFDALGLSATVPDFESQIAHFVENAPYKFTGGITYPSGGDDRPFNLGRDRLNVLDQNLTEFRSGEPYIYYGFVAVLPPGTELTVRLTRTMGDLDVSWFFNGVRGLDWWFERQPDGSSVQEFTAAHDGEIDLELFSFDGTGAATIDYFEYGSATPTFSKNVTWAPAP